MNVKNPGNWFEKNRTQTDSILDKWVEDSNYNQGIMIVAASAHAFTTFGAGFVDLLRLGGGVKVGAIKKVKAIQDIAHMAPNDRSVLILAVRVMKGDKVIGGYAIYAYKDFFGRLRFFDRTVDARFGGTARGVFKSVDEIAPYYGATSIVPYEASALQNVYIKSIGLEVPKLTIPILGVMAEAKD